MGVENWSVAAKFCDSCKTASASLFCQADSAFLCMGCDTKVHAANKLASRHARVWMCEVCERAPASVTCRADAAALCIACDQDIHSANPLAGRHERHPVVPFYDSKGTANSGGLGVDYAYFTNLDDGDGGEAEEAEAASWLLPNPKPNQMIDSPDPKSADCLFSDMDPYLDIDIFSGDRKPHNHQQQHSSGADCVVPEQSKSCHQPQAHQLPVVEGFPAYEVDYSGSKPFMYNFSSNSISQSVSSSSLEVGVVPDHNAMADVSNTFPMSSARTAAASADAFPFPIAGIDREARVLRYREKRKNRKFEKTIRYASRKAYAETRPRIKGRFAKRSDSEVESLISADASYGIVPTY